MPQTRTLTAPQAGPITIDASLLGAHGTVTIRTDRTIKAAEIAIRTTDESGPSADAVHGARLQWDARGALVAHVKGNGSQGTNLVTGTGGIHVVQNFGVITGTVTGVVITGNGNSVTVGGRRADSRQGVVTLPSSSPIEITARVPEGSSVLVRTHSGDILATGTFAAVAATTQSGEVSVPGKAEQVTASTQSGAIDVNDSPSLHVQTQSGGIRLGRTDVAEATTMSGSVTVADFGGTARLNTMSGAIRVHANAGGDITAKSMSGSITVTATDQAQADGLDVKANSMSGRVTTPQRRSISGPRRRTS
ncbi:MULTISPECIES: DUF4097 family beta strand repeat-containing protein [unclassified Streptomyces]|uniref:DUF4097 family beta strand repeat-containing protein n=1 Tax=unclassified Streptomyces TaxID=2593676 RepID=UPI000DC7B6C5|nr:MULTISPECIES: DUF4097 family beta strand repeat-containing protein [unclassified Streptomyces]AWZ06874.1 hypothetical protein DRB89_22165 [Streptomyces sp. ICC4]AWZ14547.1 hypothetical protein DRB96_22365 [Streptomyces sp. ICC1]